MRVTLALAAAGLTAALLSACGDDPANEADPDRPTGSATADPDELDVAEVVTGLDSPWGLAPLADGGLLIGSRDDATISLLEPGSDEPRVVGEVDGVRASGESGLLGLTLARDQSTLYAYRTGETENGIVAMSWDGERLGPPEEIVGGIPGGASFHQGGALVLGPDGNLWVGTGDNGVPEDAHDPDSLSGKVLRFTTEGDPTPDNTSGTAVYSLGHRNVEGLVFDDADRLWASEFGQDRYDELNVIGEGLDYGWPEVEGTGGGDEFTDPAAVWSTDDASPSGIASWDGSLWLAALRGARLWEVRPDDARASTPGDGTTRLPGVEDPVAHLVGRYGRIRNAVAAVDGSAMWVVTSNTDGRGDPDDGDDRLLSITR